MEFHDPDREDDDLVEIGIERSPRTGPGTAGWVMVAAGIVGYLVVQLAQSVRYGFTDVLLNTVYGLGFLFATVVATAGVFVIVVQRWLLPELVAAIEASGVREDGAVPGEAPDAS